MEVYINIVFTLWDMWGLLNITLTWVKFAWEICLNFGTHGNYVWIARWKYRIHDGLD